MKESLELLKGMMYRTTSEGENLDTGLSINFPILLVRPAEVLVKAFPFSTSGALAVCLDNTYRTKFESKNA